MNRRLLAMLTALMASVAVMASDVVKTTMVYAVRENADTLRLDRYETASGEAGRPVVIFAFGGGFRGGSRDEARLLPYFEFLAREGYVVASIDYRTTLSDYDPSTGVEGFVPALQGAVGTAVEDLYTATAFIAANADGWGVDPAKMILSGSSAGAITALQAEYLIASGSPYASMFPEGFNYAGVVSFAGAVCTEGEPVWTPGKVCPMMLFHGDADSTVPFGALTVGGMGMYGSKAISDGLTAAGIPHELYVICAADHSVATSPLEGNHYDILAFLREFVGRGDNRITMTRQSVPGAPTDYNTHFTLMDYLKSNMPQR